MDVQQMLSQQGAPADESLDKVVQSVMESLGMMYKECHRIDPSGQACQAVQQIMQAVSEVGNNIHSMGDTQPPPQDSFAAASQNVMQQMAQPQGGPSPV